jgi:hypothetical protein
MSNMNLSDLEIEVLFFGKWRFNTNWEKISIELKDDMTYEQTKIQTFLVYKPSEFIIGNKFTGVWHVNDRRLCLVVKTVPKSLFNLRLPILSKLYIADIIANVYSMFLTENYEVQEINSSQVIINHEDETIVGVKIK